MWQCEYYLQNIDAVQPMRMSTLYVLYYVARIVYFFMIEYRKNIVSQRQVTDIVAVRCRIKPFVTTFTR